MWACPHCGLPLLAVQEGASLACARRHTFDCAKEGYVNLLPSNRKRARHPGDSPEMVAARRRVHSAGAYRTLSGAVVDTVEGIATTGPLLDLGCGEGYYCQTLASAFPERRLLGIDISRAAVRLAAKACPEADFAVASAFRIPLADDSMAAVVRVFAPSDDGEVIRVLRPAGFYLEVTPEPRHLWEVREQLYDTPREHAPARTGIAGMRLIKGARVQYPLATDSALLADIVAMTPFAWRGHREKRDALRAASPPTVTMAFSLQLFCLDA